MRNGVHRREISKQMDRQNGMMDLNTGEIWEKRQRGYTGKSFKIKI